ncbi:MAG: TRAP transporter small permease [Oceanospirillaceae bacterium]|nr:TRAP transporter small permease [Oceanospirillaceae bacterium]
MSQLLVKTRSIVSLYEQATMWLALLGGAVLTLMAITTVISVAGRYFFSEPIQGDTEIVQMFTAVVVALSLPYCQMRLGNVIVDVLTASAPKLFRLTMDIIGSLLLGTLFAILAYYTFEGSLSAAKYGNETMMLRMKEWPFYDTIAFGFVLTAIAGLIKPIALIADYKGSK